MRPGGVSTDKAGFHVGDGLYLERLEDGIVRVRKYASAHVVSLLVSEVILDSNTWVSAVCAVSKAGENYERVMKASQFHNEE